MARTIQRLRAAIGMTQQQLASKLGLSVTSIARYETNFTPDRDVLVKLIETAHEAKLPIFEAFFSEQLGPIADVELLEQEGKASGTLLIETGESLRQASEHSQLKGLEDRVLRARLALTILLVGSISEKQLSAIESVVGNAVLQTDSQINQMAGQEVSSRDYEFEQKRVRYIQDPTPETWKDWREELVRHARDLALKLPSMAETAAELEEEYLNIRAKIPSDYFSEIESETQKERLAQKAKKTSKGRNNPNQ